MGLFDIFTQQPQQQPVVQQTSAAQPVVNVPQQQGNIPDAPTVNVDPNNLSVPAVAPIAPAAEPEVEQSPLDQFKTLWDTVPNEDEKLPAKQVPLTAEAVQKSMAKADFSSAATAEQLTAIQEGGEPASAAMMQIINDVARQVMVQSTMVNNKLNERAIAEAVAANEATLPTRLRNQAATDHLNTANPLYANPAIKPVVEAAHNMLLQKYPTETNAQIATRVNDYMMAMSQQFAPQDVINNNNGVEDVNWEKFLSM